MSTNKMLIDATHPEETRVVVLREGRVEEFDYESAARKLLRGNIYLAKVTRVEPALQAAFVEYGGNRHGFLAFNEIHPDYYQIPVADRQALIEEEAAAEAEEEAAADARAEAMSSRAARGGGNNRWDGGQATGPDDGVELPDESGESFDAGADNAVAAAASAAPDAPEIDSTGGERPGEPHRTAPEASGQSERDARSEAAPEPDANGDGGVQEVVGGADAEAVEQVGSEDALEEMAVRPRRRPRSYKIHEVIKRRQVILVQVVKEERGNKGAALTTYLSLAGRYTVLMPNTGRGGGISRKITNPQDRKRLKAIANELEVPEGMGLIIRTAGAARTKQEIKRDFEYLLRLWESVRELTLESSAPNLVYEEGNLIKRSIRDLYNKDVEDVIVAGEEAHREAKDFMRMLMPSHAKNVIHYGEPEPLFARFQIERQLNAMFSPYVTLRSGGYLVINQTEALVAVDVNSGKSTREFSIEETALNTNLEAADEIARQLKLRDLAGLIVIDFIDMEEKRNNRSVERRLKDALRLDRARIQVGHISHFGLMEMSRQRLRTGVLEGSTTQCPHCQGTGIIRSTESVALAVLRGVEDAILAGAHTSLVATTTPAVALYILNNKRAFVIDMESRLGLPIAVQGSDKMQGASFTIEKGAALAQAPRRTDRAAVNMDWGFDGEAGEDAEAAAGHDVEAERADDAGPGPEDGGRRRGRRRRPRRDGWREPEAGHDAVFAPANDVGEAGLNGDGEGDEQNGANGAEPDEIAGPGEDPNPARRGRRRGRRGGRRGRDQNAGARDEGGSDFAARDQPDGESSWDRSGEDRPGGGSGDRADDFASDVAPAADAPNAYAGATHQGAAGYDAEPDAAPSIGGASSSTAVETEAPRETRPRRDGASGSPAEPRLERVVMKPGEGLSVPDGGTEAEAESKPARKGWWQRKFEGA